jgi:hypothetical protein
VNVGVDVELVHLDDCPNWREASARLGEAMRRVGLDPARLRHRCVATAHAPADFPGSPTILIGGRDAFPAPTTAGPTCRRYANGRGGDVAPSVPDLIVALTRELPSSSLEVRGP